MKMSKRLFVILFTGILILSLAACGGTSKNRATADASANGTTVDSGTDVSDQLYVFVAGQTKLEYMQNTKQVSRRPVRHWVYKASSLAPTTPTLRR